MSAGPAGAIAGPVQATPGQATTPAATYRTQFSDGFQNSRRTRPATALTGDYHGSGTPIALRVAPDASWIFGEGIVKKMYVESKVWNDYPSNTELIDRLAKLPLAYQPGTTWDYSHATDVLGRLIEVISSRSLYQFEKERLLDPLGMKDTSFYVSDKGKQDRIAEPFPNDRTIGIDADFNDPRVVQKWESGGGGMVSTAMDYARFLQMLLNGGMLDGKRAGFTFGLGFAVRKDAGVSPYAGSVGEFNWGGAGGTYFWIDPKEDMFVDSATAREDRIPGSAVPHDALRPERRLHHRCRRLDGPSRLQVPRSTLLRSDHGGHRHLYRAAPGGP